MTNAAPAPEQPSLIRTAGFSYFPIAFLARLPFAMNVVGVLTLVAFARDSLALGGLTSAACGLGTAAIGPLLGAAADRFGQRPVVLASAVANSLALLLMSWIAYADVADGWVLAVAVLVGATAPQVSPLSRSRLVGMINATVSTIRKPKTLGATLAYESSVDEIVFVFGPVIVGVLAATLNPAAPLIASAALTLVAVGAFGLHRTARTPRSHHSPETVTAPVSDLFRPRVLVLILGMLAIGFFFGSTLTSLTAFMTDRGEGETAGVFYGVMGVGSAILALSVALMPARFTIRNRWVVFAAILLGGAVLISRAHDVPSMVGALALAGIGIGPLIVTVYTFATLRTPPGRSATMMTMVGAGVVVGQSISSAVVGALAERAGTGVALVAPVISAALVLLAAIINWFLARRD
ncbi:MFS transporter [Microbacterium gorillae]|uniref:MFS transporter n=1 Tax=Microbacterium gorillae TaxID=1231063 RepID=UPI00059161C6|nr:MFS transporter [Microbacterium gorillae]